MQPQTTPPVPPMGSNRTRQMKRPMPWATFGVILFMAIGLGILQKGFHNIADQEFRGAYPFQLIFPVSFMDLSLLYYFCLGLVVDRFMDRRDSTLVGITMMGGGMLLIGVPAIFAKVVGVFLFTNGLALGMGSLLGYWGSLLRTLGMRMEVGYALLLGLLALGNWGGNLMGGRLWEALERGGPMLSLVGVGVVLFALLLRKFIWEGRAPIEPAPAGWRVDKYKGRAWLTGLAILLPISGFILVFVLGWMLNERILITGVYLGALSFALVLGVRFWTKSGAALADKWSFVFLQFTMLFFWPLFKEGGFFVAREKNVRTLWGFNGDDYLSYPNVIMGLTLLLGGLIWWAFLRKSPRKTSVYLLPIGLLLMLVTAGGLGVTPTNMWPFDWVYDGFGTWPFVLGACIFMLGAAWVLIAGFSLMARICPPRFLGIGFAVFLSTGFLSLNVPPVIKGDLPFRYKYGEYMADPSSQFIFGTLALLVAGIHVLYLLRNRRDPV